MAASACIIAITAYSYLAGHSLICIGAVCAVLVKIAFSSYDTLVERVLRGILWLRGDNRRYMFQAALDGVWEAGIKTVHQGLT